METSVEKLNGIAHKLELHGYKWTKQRTMTLEVLLEKDSGYLTAEEIFMRIKSKYPQIGLSTVYRTLGLLNELHIVRKVTFNDKSTRFGLRDDDSDHLPPHLICKACGLIEKVNEDWLSELELHLRKEFGFQVFDYQLDFIGTYAECNENTCKKPNPSAP
ncbi:hypothetical protein UB51_09045 [Paenibacillus sp. IHBB 10380]|nr:hypothetical protein UB51_09045 [Paenibacillus sp. IHBB 10380]